MFNIRTPDTWKKHMSRSRICLSSFSKIRHSTPPRQTMVFLLPRRLLDKVWPEALLPPASSNGQTVIVTGATSGLGLAAAVHFTSLGAKLILTTRSLSAGIAAQAYVERSAGIVGQGEIQIMELEMSRYSSCIAFVGQ
jgi:hypothetical protein